MNDSIRCSALVREFYVKEKSNLIRCLEETAIKSIYSKLINDDQKTNLIKVLLNTAYQIGKTG